MKGRGVFGIWRGEGARQQWTYAPCRIINAQQSDPILEDSPTVVHEKLARILESV